MQYTSPCTHSWDRISLPPEIHTPNSEGEPEWQQRSRSGVIGDYLQIVKGGRLIIAGLSDNEH